MIDSYIGEKPNHTHENTALEDFLESLQPHWGRSAEVITVIAYALWNGAEIDAVCILPRAIVVVDFKNHGGHVQITENGPWHGDDGLIKGGSKINPFAQVRDNKQSVISWLKRYKLLPACNLGHVSGVVLFARPTVVDGDLGPRINSWFHVTDLDRCAEALASLSSPEIQIDQSQVRTVLDALGVSEHRALRLQPRVVHVDSANLATEHPPKLTETQQEVLGTIVRFLEDPTRKSLSVLGMAQTGKTLLLTETLKKIERMGRQAIVLVPNARISRRMRGVACRSIYSHLYDRNSPKHVKTDGAQNGRKLDVETFPMKLCEDIENCVYLIDEAHLIGNDYFQIEDGKQYGSGRLFDDFLDFTGLGSSLRQVVLFGDPFQLPRGSREAMPLFGDLQRAQGLAATEIALTEMFDIPSRATPLANARRLAEAISAGQFSTLHLEAGDGLTIVSRRDAREKVRESFQRRPGESWLIAETHAKVATYNQSIRKRLFGQTSDQPITSGDLLEFYNTSGEGDDPFEEMRRSLDSGDRLVVERASSSSILHSQALTGRPKPIEFATRQVDVVCGSDRTVLAILEDFLLAEKPELEADVVIGLNVWRKMHPSQPVTRARYGYATTGHHAQGISQPICFIDAGVNGRHHSEHYFRWLYTAITRASEHCIVFDFRTLDPFSEARWNDQGALEVTSLPIGGRWRIGHEHAAENAGTLSSEHLGGSGAHASRRSEILEKAVHKLLPPAWQVVAVKSFPYQEQYKLRDSQGAEVSLNIHYNQAEEVTSMRESGTGAGHDLVILMAESATLAGQRDSCAETIVRSLRERAATKVLRVVGAHRDGDYRLTAMLISSDDERAQVEINHDKNGIVSVVRLIKHTGGAIPLDARDALFRAEEDS